MPATSSKSGFQGSAPLHTAATVQQPVAARAPITACGVGLGACLCLICLIGLLIPFSILLQKLKRAQAQAFHWRNAWERRGNQMDTLTSVNYRLKHEAKELRWELKALKGKSALGSEETKVHKRSINL